MDDETRADLADALERIAALELIVAALAAAATPEQADQISRATARTIEDAGPQASVDRPPLRAMHRLLARIAEERQGQ